MLQEYLFDTPYWLLALLALLGVSLLLAGARRGRHGFVIGGIGALAAGVILVVLGHFVQTPRKQVMSRTRQVVADVDAGNFTGLKQLLDPQVRLDELTRDDIILRAQSYTRELGLHNFRIDSLQIRKVENDRIEEDVAVATDSDRAGALPPSIPSTWRLIWYNTADGWRIGEIQPISVSNGDASVIDEDLRK